MKLCQNVTKAGVYGPYTLVKCLLKTLIFGSCKKDVLSLTVMGLTGGKKPINWSLFSRPYSNFIIEATDFKLATDKDYMYHLYLIQF